jgi:hypothetical protein
MRVAYPGSSRRADHFSCRNYFNPSYGLKDMIFRSFKQFSEFILKSEMNYDVSITQC